MSSDESPNAPAPSERRDAVREKAQQVQARQSRARAIRRFSIASVRHRRRRRGAVVVTWTVSSAASKPMLQPANVVDDGFLVTGVSGVGVATTSTETDPRPRPATPPRRRLPRRRDRDPTAADGDQPAVDIRVYVDYLSSGFARLPGRERPAARRVGHRGRRDAFVLPGRDADGEVQRHEVLAARGERGRLHGRRTRPTPSSRTPTRSSRSSPTSTPTASPTPSSPTSRSPRVRTRRRSCARCIEKQVVRHVGEGSDRPGAEGPSRHR